MGIRAAIENRRPPLVVRFGVLMAVTFTGFGLVLSSIAADIVADRSFTTKTRVAELITRTAVLPSLADEGDTVRVAEDSALERVVVTEFKNGSLERFRLWIGTTDSAQAQWAVDPDVIGRQIDPDGPLEAAFRGETTWKILGDPEDAHANGITTGRLIEVFVPVVIADRPGDIDAIATVFLPYEEAAAELAADQREVQLAVLAGLIVLFFVSFPVIARASRKLQRFASRSEYEARHDALTGLANRSLFVERIEEAIEAQGFIHPRAAVLFIDLDRFKDVNDTLGHDAGDKLLIDVAERLSATLRDSDTIARLGGDEFGLVLPGLTTREDVVTVARKILASLDSGFELAGLTLDVGASIGISLYPEHADDASSLLRYADIAMYEAKKDGRSYSVYAAVDEGDSIDGLRMLSELRAALSNGDLTLSYQPKVDLASGSTESMEALIRWHHPRHGSIGPDRFIPIAESSGLMGELTEYVLESAIGQLAGWLDQGLDLSVAVNISAKNLNDLGFPAVVRSTLERHGMEPQRVELELTETALMTNQTRAMNVLAELADIGVELAIDDFGTGYSSLAYLQRLPVGVIKIDRSFIAKIESDPDSQTIVRSTISMARSLGLDVVAEGVETDDVRRLLLDDGCRTAQGYFFARPMPAAEVADWMRTQAGQPASV